MPYRVNSTPSKVDSATRSSLVSAVSSVLLVTHGGSLVVLWLAFAVLDWTGQNGLLGLAVRAVGSLAIVILAFTGAAKAAAHHGTARGAMIRAIGLAAFYLAISLLLRDVVRDAHSNGPPVLFPRAGVIAAPANFVSLLAASVINPAIVMIAFFGLFAAAANKRRVRERAFRLLCEAPCTKCGGPVSVVVDRLECAACGEAAPLPTPEDVEAIANVGRSPPQGS